MSELLSAEKELEVSHGYSEMSDDALYERILYWKDQPTNPERSERSQKLAKTVLDRLAFEIRVRTQEEQELETALGQDSVQP